MLLSFEFPFLDIRSFLSVDTHKLPICDNFDFTVAGNHDFIRSFGEVRQRETPHEIQASSESIYCTAKNSVKLDSNNSYTFGRNKMFVPKCTYKRLFTNGVNCRVDIGIENTFKTKYNYFDMTSIANFLFLSTLYVPKILNNGITGYYALNMRDLGKRLSELYLNATTENPKLNHPQTSNKWIIHTNPMLLVEANKDELNTLYFDKGAEIFIPEFTDWNIRLFYCTNSNFISNYFVPMWVIIEDDSSPKDIIRNLRVYLMKLHQDRECFKQVLKLFSTDIRNKTFVENIFLKQYIEEYIYKSLLKKRRYGFPNDKIIKVIDKVDSTINRHQIESLIEYFDTELLKSIEERRREKMDKQDKQQIFNFNGGNQAGFQFGNENEQKFDVEGDLLIGGNKLVNEFGNQANEAINRINAMAELEDGQKKYLVTIMNEAKIATEENNEDKKKSCKEKFSAFIMGAGKIADKVISTLANLTSIVSFFGFGVK